MNISSTVIQLAFLLFVGWVNEYSAQEPDFSNCGQTIQLQPNTVQVVRSPGYPGNYAPGSSCRYHVIAPIGYQVNLNCRVDTVATTNCAGDRLDVARSGSFQVNTDQRYCGGRTFITTSYTNELVFSQLSPNDFQSTGGSYYCRLYTSTGCACGSSNSRRIVGGFSTPANGNPGAAAILDRETGLRCGATIIDATTVLTAAHCIDPTRIQNSVIRVGDNNFLTQSESPYAADYAIQSYVIHEGYNTETNANDIAIIRTAPISYSPAVSASCLPFGLQTNTFEGENVDAYGWGALQFGGQVANNLNQVSLNVIGTQECNARGAARGISVTGSQICTYKQGGDFCTNDSGGPVGWRNPNNGLYYVLGVQSFGYGCATNIPGVSTRTSSYLRWILNNSPGAHYCYV